ncbi:hypothetical protein JCM21714_3872 [Gracilibacillus boraciitolerans JCM 21714]|uniref:Lipoprotein n=1 Tax=Gracilibacillus boraciitolerans JCM 21714 TaxID=1298598 RepID=W4VNG0_9BACI|nr:hypothetical protein [Gracilibacillus boraciitolerans]GAE94691.1 hypothetical protein JCM21714_3872 [Gracilibacillus boraciitolerans JCM 21714]
MKLIKISLLSLMILTACSSNSEILKISEPNFTDHSSETNYQIEGATLIHTIENKEEIDEIASLIENADAINEPDLVKQAKPNAIIEIYNQKENTSKFKRTIWLASEMVILKTPSGGEYYQISAEQAELLINNIDI